MNTPTLRVDDVPMKRTPDGRLDDAPWDDFVTVAEQHACPFDALEEWYRQQEVGGG